MTSIFWRRASGPLITGVAACFYLSGDLAQALPPPTPGAFALTIILFSTLFGGPRAGLVSALICILSVAVSLSEPGQFLVFTPDHLVRLGFLTSFGLAAPLIVEHVRMRTKILLRRERGARAKVEAANRELMILRAALDKVDYGVLLLDEDLRARFMNDAFRHIWGLDADTLGQNFTFADLVLRARNAGVDIARPAARQDYFVDRVARVRAGDERPVDLRLSNGAILRVQCKILPGGGRFLSYTDVSDLVHQAEDFERLATTDDLTGLFNRRHYLALAEAAFTRCRDHAQPLALMILDIDLFKSINDRFGHGVGDAVIRHVADICREARRDGDILARIGGEEFTLLMPDTRRDQAIALAEHIRRRLAACPVIADGHRIRVTASIGVTDANLMSGSLGDVMRHADQALYDAKRNGRNRVDAGGRTMADAAERMPCAVA